MRLITTAVGKTVLSVSSTALFVSMITVMRLADSIEY